MQDASPQLKTPSLGSTLQTTGAARSLAIAILAISAACKPEARQPDSRAAASQPQRPAADSASSSHNTWLVGASPAEDFLNADATEAGLRERLGAAVVRTDSVDVGEGESELGTVLYSAQPRRRLEILWEDTLTRAHPRVVYLRSDNSEWRIYPGVGIGTRSHTLDSLNGRPFSLAGFGWDYSGTTSSYNGGHLDSLWRSGSTPGGAVQLRLAPDSAAPDSLETQVLGETVYASNTPAMHALNPRIYEILVHPRPRPPGP